MDRRASYEFKDVKRMRRDNSNIFAITKQQQQAKRRPLAVFKSSHEEGLNYQTLAENKNQLNNKENIPTKKFQALAGKENLLNQQIQSNECGLNVPQVQSTFRIFVDDNTANATINQTTQKVQSEINENVCPHQQELINKENILPQLQTHKFEPCLPLALQSCRIGGNDGSSTKSEVNPMREEVDQTDSKMEVVTTLIKPSLVTIPTPEVYNDRNIPSEESCAVNSRKNDDSSEDIGKRPNNKRKSSSLYEVDIYSDDIHSYLRQAERFHRPKCDYMDKQCDVNGTMRSILIDWLVEVSEEYKLRDRTLYLAISYIDRFLSAMSVRRSKLQLVGTAALFIAAKFQEIYPPDCAEFAYITDDTYNVKQVLKMESLMLKVLSFNLSCPTAVDFLERYSIEVGLDNEIRALSMYLTELTLKDYGFLQFMPSLVATAAVSLALHTFNLKHWPLELSSYTNYQWHQISPCLNSIYEAFRLAHTQPQRAVVDKYKSPRYHRVSLLRPPTKAPS